MHKNIKDKIINDPIYGIISIKEPIIHEIIEHPYFQRLRRISQLGLVNLVYPGANHTRFQHALGTLHLMQKVITHLNNKGNFISKKEAIDLKLAILLHDIGHGPFSHALENVIIDDHNHEKISLMFMQILNEKFKKKLSGCIKIFTNNIPLFTVTSYGGCFAVSKDLIRQHDILLYKRLLDIYSSSSKTVDALMKLELPSGVEVEIKV